MRYLLKCRETRGRAASSQLARAFGVVVIVATLAACGGPARGEAPAVELERLSAESDQPVYWLGQSFEGLALTEIVGQQTERSREPAPPLSGRPSPGATLIYGECDGQGSGDTFHCTGRQIQVQQWPIASPARYPHHFNCTRTTIRGVPAAQWDGFEVYTGAALLKIYAPTQAQARRAARALRRVSETSSVGPLPPPAIDVASALRRCAGDSLEIKLTEIRRGAGTELLWLGRGFEGEPLFRVEGDGRTTSTFMYGGCRTPEVAGSCYPAITVVVTPAADERPFSWHAVRAGIGTCDQVTVRGARAATHRGAEELVVFTGEVAILLRGPDFHRLLRAAAALRGIEENEPRGVLDPTTAEISAELDATCTGQ